MTWPLVRLGEAVSFRGGGTPRKDNPRYWSDDVPWATVKDFKGLKLEKTRDSISKEGLDASAANLIPAGHVIIPTRMALGKAAINTIDLAINQDLRALIPRRPLDATFLLHLILSLADVIEKNGAGATVKGITQDRLSEIPIPLPPLAEQKRIAAILDTADALRAKRREAIAQLDTLVQSVFLDMFGDPVTNPMGWEMEPLGKVCDVRDGTHDSPKYIKEGRWLLTSKNFKDGAIDYDGAGVIAEEDFMQINKRSKVDVGDLVMPMIGTIGNPVLVEEEPHFAIKNVALIKFLATSPDNRFVHALLCSHYFDHVTLKANRGGTQKFVALKDLRSMPIPLPPLDIQHRFTAIVESLERQKAAQRVHLAELDILFSSLQQRAFSGQL